MHTRAAEADKGSKTTTYGKQKPKGINTINWTPFLTIVLAILSVHSVGAFQICPRATGSALIEPPQAEDCKQPPEAAEVYKSLPEAAKTDLTVLTHELSKQFAAGAKELPCRDKFQTRTIRQGESLHAYLA
ncbi:unnamed protein product [Bursaphelenchus xylophilus]|uniref:(pine wood nematode) hypothetical protein n=1 Tax=Bursaphelenchus xylophilus TaxID=6326 RepID=A0A1I7S8J2_BURXY|nr:unnamed protein product [Bursaphelenchus xylophilus]CAG9121127.1 unnamed protein product [Bursaphelenchus xylophilus]